MKHAMLRQRNCSRDFSAAAERKVWRQKNAAYCIGHINIHRESDRIFSDPVCLVVFPSPEGNGIFQLDRILQTEAEKQVAGAGHLCAVFACGAGCGTVVPHADVSVYRSG